jgi:hypothetical protein
MPSRETASCRQRAKLDTFTRYVSRLLAATCVPCALGGDSENFSACRVVTVFGVMKREKDVGCVLLR